jgi:hypothetical protein
VARNQHAVIGVLPKVKLLSDGMQSPRKASLPGLGTGSQPRGEWPTNVTVYQTRGKLLLIVIKPDVRWVCCCCDSWRIIMSGYYRMSDQESGAVENGLYGAPVRELKPHERLGNISFGLGRPSDPIITIYPTEDGFGVTVPEGISMDDAAKMFIESLRACGISFFQGQFKDPVAFRVGKGDGSWELFQDEEAALRCVRKYADKLGAAKMQSLYVRDVGLSK